MTSGIESLANGTLEIRSVAKAHEGYYLCQANNGIGAGLGKLIRLTVNGKKQLHNGKSPRK